MKHNHCSSLSSMASKAPEDLDCDSDLNEVFNMLIEIKHLWYILGVNLGLETSKLDAIEATYPQRFKMALLDMLKQWLKQTQEPRSWKALVKALREPSLKEEKIANEIEVKYTEEKIIEEETKRSSGVPANSEKALMTPPTPVDFDAHLEQQFSSDHSDDSDFESKSRTEEKLSYQCLDMSGMSESEKHSLCGKLTNEYRHIVSEYSKLNRSIRKSLKDRQIVPQQMSEVLMELNTFSLREHDKNKKLLDERMDEIESAKDINHVFKLLRPYSSFFDCFVIKHIVDSQLCTGEDRESLSKYLEKLNAYCQRSIYECPHFATPNHDPKFRNLVMKIDDDISSSFTIKALDAFRHQLATTLNLEGHTLRLCTVEKGCLQLTFQLPTFVLETIFPLSLEQKKELEKLHIQWIKCSGTQFTAPRTEMTLEIQQSSMDSLPIVHSAIHSSSGIPSSSRYGYIHADGVECYKNFFMFQFHKSKHAKVLLDCKQTEDIDGLIYEEKDFDLPDFEVEPPLHTLLEFQDRAMNRHLKVFLKEEYMTDICQKLLVFLTWLSKQRLTPKLEGRFGLLPWRQNAEKCDVLDFQTDHFVRVAFDDPSAHFLAKVSEEDVEKLKLICCKKGGSVDELETYDFKLTSKGEKLDIRLKFCEGKPIVVTVKKFEHKVAIFDVLCLNRKYDMRVSLNTYESASTDSNIAKNFASTVHVLSPGVISFVPRAKDNEWTIAFIRHKRIHTLYFNQPKYVVTVSNVGQLPIKLDDLKPDETITVRDTEYEHRSETELHNLSWEVAFGHQIGLKPEESLVLFTGQDSIHPDLYSVLDQGEWTPDKIMEEFKKDGFMNMMENINEILD